MKKFEGALLACDMDGTLLDSERRISAGNREALRYFTEEGGLFSLATGRAPGAARPYYDMLPLNAPYSLLNGALLCDTAHRILQCAGMPEETKELIGAVTARFSEIGCEIFAGERILVRQLNSVTETHLRTLRLTYDRVGQQELGDTHGWCKINLTGEPAALERVRGFLQPYAARFCMASSTPMFLEITESHVHKGAAMRRIAALCGVQREHVYAIGDSYNDETMLREAAVGFAPANAEEGILRLAGVVVRHNDRDAVAAAVEWLDNRYA